MAILKETESGTNTTQELEKVSTDFSKYISVIVMPTYIT